MTKMIEVPEEHLLALKRWRDWRALPPFVDALIACLPKPIEVGSMVRTSTGHGAATVIAVDGDEAWVRFGHGGSGIWAFKSLEVIE